MWHWPHTGKKPMFLLAKVGIMKLSQQALHRAWFSIFHSSNSHIGVQVNLDSPSLVCFCSQLAEGWWAFPPRSLRHQFCVGTDGLWNTTAESGKEKHGSCLHRMSMSPHVCPCSKAYIWIERDRLIVSDSDLPHFGCFFLFKQSAEDLFVCLQQCQWHLLRCVCVSLSNSTTQDICSWPPKSVLFGCNILLRKLLECQERASRSSQIDLLPTATRLLDLWRSSCETLAARLDCSAQLR